MDKDVARLAKIQDFDLKGKVVLARLDHNVVGNGRIKDAFRVDSTFGLIHYIASKGAFPIIMTHVGRTRDKTTGKITSSPVNAVTAVVDYLNRKLEAGFFVPDLPIDENWGITSLDEKILAPLLSDLKKRKIGGIYLPNTRWFAGEESADDKTKALAAQLAAIADIYVNDAFGSWQPHCSTYDVAALMPSCAGFLMQKELENLHKVLSPEPPFVAIVAGSKYDTKIGPLNMLYEKVDHLILGGVIYNAYLCAKYGIEVADVDASEVKLAKDLVEKDKNNGKILELGALVESKSMDTYDPSLCRVVEVSDFKAGQKYAHFLDIAPKSFENSKIIDALGRAKTIFINAVMGFVPNFSAGSASMYSLIDKNKSALKLYGGGDTLTEFKNLLPGVYLKALDNPSYYFFTGGGAVLSAIEKASPYGLKPVAALLR